MTLYTTGIRKPEFNTPAGGFFWLFHFYKETIQQWNTRAVRRSKGGEGERRTLLSVVSLHSDVFKQLLYHTSTFRSFSTGGVFSLNWYMTENKRLLVFWDSESISEGPVLYLIKIAIQILAKCEFLSVCIRLRS